MEIDWSNYETPVQVVTDKMNTKLERHILQAIQNVGVVVDKEELIKAINYDREQYSKGFKNGYNKAVDDTVKAIKKEYAFTILEEEKINEIAEQLKESCSNAG